MIAEQEVKYVGTSLTSAEEWRLRSKYQPIAQDVFGAEARLRDGQAVRFREVAARLLEQAGWRPGASASVDEAVHILREHVAELAPYVEVKERAANTAAQALESGGK